MLRLFFVAAVLAVIFASMFIILKSTAILTIDNVN